MCEIQFVMSKELANDCISNFNYMLEEGSQHNDDATGVFGEHFTWKVGKAYEDFKKGKVNSLKDYMNKYATNWLVGHNRLATKGSESDNFNNHPFENDSCVVVHNGIINNDDSLAKQYSLSYKAQTDSAIVPALIDMYIGNGDDEISAVKKTAESITGSYSIFVLMKESKRLFYFKNSGTSFHMMQVIDENDNTSVYGSTCKESLENLGYIKSGGLFETDLFKRRTFGTPDSGTIYEIVYKGKLDVHPISEFTIKKTSYDSSSWGTGWGGYGDGAYRGWKTHDYTNIHDDDIILDDEIDEAFEECIRELDYLETDVDVIETLRGSDVDWYDNSRTVCVREVQKYVGDLLKTHLRATEWFDHTSADGFANYSIKYDEIRRMVSDGLIYKSGDVDVSSWSEGDDSL